MKAKFYLLETSGRLLLQVLLPFFFTCTCLHAQTNEWTWIKGSNAVNVLGVYGTLGVAAATNQPGGRYDPASWTDAAGNFWIFGGWGYASVSTTSTLDGGAGFLNDLWKYTISTNQWTWMGGSKTAAATTVYGTQNVGNAANAPGARYGPATWVDASGNLWLFGGANGADQGTTSAIANITNHYNDLWEYNVTSGEWIWVGGSQTNNEYGVYGTEGTAATTNLPGGRFNSAVWTDALGNFWLFGGGGMPATGQSGTYGYLNDLWKYNPTAGTWTWENGGDGVAAAGTYGTKGTAAAGNTPGGRYAASGIVDGSGNLWLFGGASGTVYSSENLFFEDLWKYNIAANQWTWMSGDNATTESGVYGAKGTAAAANHPGGRAAPANWRTTIGGTIILFGGVGYDVNGNLGYLEDIWVYNIAPGQWTWLYGANTYDQDGVYGTMGVAATTNNPGGRYSVGNWVDNKGDLWLFGGHGFPATGATPGYLEDLWEFVPITVLNVNWLSFTAAPSGSQVLLNWQMAEGVKNAWFNIQRSANGGDGGWQTIGTVNAAGDGVSNYQFLDAQPLSGMNYYRLQLSGPAPDGQDEFSAVVVAEFKTGLSLICYATGENTMQARLQNGSSEPYRLWDMSGRLVQQGTLKNGETTLGPLVHGAYILMVVSGKGMITVKTAL